MVKFVELLREAGKQAAWAGNDGRSFTLMIDGVDQLSDVHSARLLQWLPDVIPEVSGGLTVNFGVI